MIGRLVSGRYLIEAKVGTGGTAVVYRAHDNQTDRTVAVKVLRPEYEADMDFVLRFGQEAEAAAKVSHENIVNLLDVGIDGEMRYIVMEHVDGSTLKEMIRLEGKIHPDVALRMTIRILAAVDHAHRNGIVHRDIKPQNILVDGEGRVKVADFGIARLKTLQNAQTDENGNAMGSVHYLSPEQARGEVADEQSDLYSVGVVLYEMLTGRVPFDGENPTEVALKHVNEAAQSVRRLNPHISKALDEVVMRALCKDKARRYQTAAEMAADLRKTISHPRGGFVVYPKVKEEPAPEDSQARKLRQQQQQEARRKRKKRALIGMAVLVGIILLAMLALLLMRQYSVEPMPALLGMQEDAAARIAEERGLEVIRVSAYSDKYEAGCVMLQSVEPGESIAHETEVVLTVSKGSQWYTLPDMTGWSVSEASAYLAEAGAATVNVEYMPNDADIGTVVFVDHAAGTVSRDEPIILRISGTTVSVPSLTGLTMEGAGAVLEAEGLRIGSVVEGDSTDAKSGTVIDQSIAPYTQVLVDSVVDLTVCRTQEMKYAPASSLTLVSPMNNVRFSIVLTTPSGQSIEAFADELDAGTHRVSLASSEAGIHGVKVYMGDLLLESMKLGFE